MGKKDFFFKEIYTTTYYIILFKFWHCEFNLKKEKLLRLFNEFFFILKLNVWKYKVFHPLYTHMN